MKLNKYNKSGTLCCIQIDGDSTKYVNLLEMQAVVAACVVTNQNCIAWRANEHGGRTQYTPLTEAYKNLRKRIRANGLNDRATRLAEEMECCKLDALCDELPQKFPLNRESQQEEEPHLMIDGCVSIYPKFEGLVLSTSCYRYDVYCAYSGDHIATCKNREQSLCEAATYAFRRSAENKLGINHRFYDVPECRGF